MTPNQRIPSGTTLRVASRPASRVCRLLEAFVAIAVVSLFASPGLSSEWESYVAQSASGMVTMGFSRLNAVPWDLKFRPIHEVEAIDVVRRDLLRQQRIRDLPVLIGELGDQRTGWISLEHACLMSYVASTGTSIGSRSVRVGDCYRIEIAATQPFENKLAMTVALSELSPRLPRI